MNLKQLSKQVGTNYRLRPLPIRVGADGAQLPDSDDQWRLEAVLEDPARVKLVNIRTNHGVEIGSDNIREYRSPDFLLLRCQLRIAGYEVSIEPIVLQAGGVAVVGSGVTSIQVAGDALRLLE